MLAGGDICHYPGIFRPSEYLRVPRELYPSPYNAQSEVPFCLGSAWEELQRSRGRNPSDTLYDMCFGHDIPLAVKTKDSLQELDCDESVFVIVAHDSSVRDKVDHFPKSLNDWKAMNWASDVKWAFLSDLKSYWQSKGLGTDTTNVDTA